MKIKYGVAALFLVLVWQHRAVAQHKVLLEIQEIEWNGWIKTQNPVLKFEKTFREKSDVFFVDTFKGKPLYGQFIYLPIYNDTSERPGFEFVLIDSLDPKFSIPILTDYKTGTYDAGIKVKDEFGLRRWTGKLRYYPDTSIHLPRPVWRQDAYTIQIESFKAWNATADAKGNQANRVLKNLYFSGLTGVKSEFRSGGKYGEENYYMRLIPVRYQWERDVWTEFTIELYRQHSNGSMVEVLKHTFSQKDKNIVYNGNRKQNAYEIRDARNKYYMLITGVMLIPY